MIPEFQHLTRWYSLTIEIKNIKYNMEIGKPLILSSAYEPSVHAMSIATFCLLMFEYLFLLYYMTKGLYDHTNNPVHSYKRQKLYCLFGVFTCALRIAYLQDMWVEYSYLSYGVLLTLGYMTSFTSFSSVAIAW